MRDTVKLEDGLFAEIEWNQLINVYGDKLGRALRIISVFRRDNTGNVKTLKITEKHWELLLDKYNLRKH